jgi:hypothetical protein
MSEDRRAPSQEPPSSPEDRSTGVEQRLDAHLAAHPHLSERLYRQLMVALHTRGVISIDAIHDLARTEAGRTLPPTQEDPNRPERDRWDERERNLVESITRTYFCEHFTAAELDDIVNLVLKREEVSSLENVATLAGVNFRRLADKVQRFCELPTGETLLAPAEVVGTRVALIRHFFSDQLEFIGIAKNHLRIRDFDEITRRIVGSDNGMGRIGGKAGGMYLAHRILAAADEEEQERTGKEPFLPVAMPESYYLRSDVVEDFLRLNRLNEYQNQKYKPIADVTREYPLIRGVFRNGDFPLEIVQKLRTILERLGTHPLAVRSSSLLEDRFGTAFSGKYASVFVANQGTLEQRLRALLGAIAEVYASIMAPDPILYRREHHLIDYEEDMAVLIQKVVGFPCGDYYLPIFAGVAFSRNEYRWSARIRREDGLVRIVMGLGTRAVDRVGADYPRMVALGAPTMRTESSDQEILRSSQQTIDVINTATNRLDSVRLQDVLAQGLELPMLDRVVSIYRDGALYPPTSVHIDAEPSSLRITFDKLLRSTPFAQRMRELLQRVEEAYGRPVDMEFACDGEKLYILQCRTLSQVTDSGPVVIPDDVPPERVLFEASRFIRSGLLPNIEYVVFVDASTYDAIPSAERRIELARVIGRLNHTLRRRSFVLIGPGRWGTRDIRLGVPVRYADINHCCMLIEVAPQGGAFVPEVSFGTHFFQDLVEADIHYLPLFPDSEGGGLNEAFLNHAPNVLAERLPEDAAYADYVRVVHIPTATGGRHLTVAMDSEADRAVAFFS